MIAKAANAVLLGEGDLLMARLAQAQVVKAHIAGQMRLVMPLVQRRGFGDIRPLGKALAPPAIVLRRGVKLGQKKCNQAWIVRRISRASRTMGGGTHVLKEEEKN